MYLVKFIVLLNFLLLSLFGFGNTAIIINSVDTPVSTELWQGETNKPVTMVVSNTEDYDVVTDTIQVTFKLGTQDVSKHYLVKPDASNPIFLKRKTNNITLKFYIDVKHTAPPGLTYIDGYINGWDNLVPNGSFEEIVSTGPVHWVYWKKPGSYIFDSGPGSTPINYSVNYSSDPNTHTDGNLSIKFTFTNAPPDPAPPNENQIWATASSGGFEGGQVTDPQLFIPVQGSTPYFFEVWTKDDISSGINRVLVFEEYKADYNPVTPKSLSWTMFNHSSTWQRISPGRSVYTSANAVYARLWVGMQTWGADTLTTPTVSGNIWWDAMKLYQPEYPISDSAAEINDSWTIKPDTTTPAGVTNLNAQAGQKTGTVKLTWTAPGDDETTYPASGYDVRYSTVPITETNFIFANQRNDEPVPSAPGTNESWTVTGLPTGATYYFAIRVADEVPNYSKVSFSPSVYVKPDDTPPLAPGTPVDDGAITYSLSQLRFSWTAAEEPESEIIKYYLCIGDTPGGTNILLDYDVVTSTDYLATNLPLIPNKTYYAKVKAQNSAGLVGFYSLNSNGIMVVKKSGAGTKLYPPYPNVFNPIKDKTAIIRYDVPQPAKVTIKLYNLTGELVKVLVNDEFKSEPRQYESVWDGTNDSKETIASGLYIIHTTIGSSSYTQKIVVVK